VTVLNFSGSPHRSALELLPWYLNGSLDPDEQAQVEQHLRGCVSCRAELESLRVLQAAYVEGDSGDQADAALQRLLPQLDDDQVAASPGRRPRKFASSPSTWLASWRRRGASRSAGLAFAGSARGPAWVKLALAVQCGVIFALGWKVIAVDRTVREEHEFRTLASSASAGRAAGSIVVVFDQATTQAEMLRILKDCGVRVVDGPTSSNAFVLALEPGRAGAVPEDAVARLRAEHAVVLAELLVSPAAQGLGQ
jgi:anti-sigma factor RsiW